MFVTVYNPFLGTMGFGRKELSLGGYSPVFTSVFIQSTPCRHRGDVHGERVHSMFLDSRNHDRQVQETRILLWSGWGVQGRGEPNCPRSAGAAGTGLPRGQVVRTQEGRSSPLRTRGDLRGVSGEEKQGKCRK